MSALTAEQIGVLLAIALVWFWLNLKAGSNWLKRLTLAGVLGFMGLASWVAIHAVGLL